jgi:hypothetical protein
MEKPMESYVDQAAQAAAPEQSDQNLDNLAPVPWVAIALAIHVILLVIAWFVLPRQAPQADTLVLIASTAELAPPPPPVPSTARPPLRRT